eukprot:SAG31_NODE_3624_length_4058_cov_2.587270_6_plen_44_part_00
MNRSLDRNDESFNQSRVRRTSEFEIELDRRQFLRLHKRSVRCV